MNPAVGLVLNLIFIAFLWILDFNVLFGENEIWFKIIMTIIFILAFIGGISLWRKSRSKAARGGFS